MTTETPLTGSYSDGPISITWTMPEWSSWDNRLCAVGMHFLTRKPVVAGYLQYVTRIERYYCACGRSSWLKYDGGFVDKDVAEPGSHLDWIQGTIKMQESFSKTRARERLMYEAHPCWGEPYRCISCGCSESGPCVGHKNGIRPNLVTPAKHAELLAMMTVWRSES